MKLPFKLISLENQEIVEAKEAYLELLDDHLLWITHFIAEEPINIDDKMMGSREVENCWRVLVLKSNAVGVDKILTHAEDPENGSLKYTWKIMISIMGMNDDIRMYFKKESEAEDFYQKISAWILKK